MMQPRKLIWRLLSKDKWLFYSGGNFAFPFHTENWIPFHEADGAKRKKNNGSPRLPPLSQGDSLIPAPWMRFGPCFAELHKNCTASPAPRRKTTSLFAVYSPAIFFIIRNPSISRLSHRMCLCPFSCSRNGSRFVLLPSSSNIGS